MSSNFFSNFFNILWNPLLSFGKIFQKCSNTDPSLHYVFSSLTNSVTILMNLPIFRNFVPCWCPLAEFPSRFSNQPQLYIPGLRISRAASNYSDFNKYVCIWQNLRHFFHVPECKLATGLHFCNKFCNFTPGNYLQPKCWDFCNFFIVVYIRKEKI